MKIIDEEKFGLLYDKLYEHLRKTDGDIRSVGIETGTTNKTLHALWKLGKTWETITLIIAYHYTRSDSVILKVSGISTLLKHGTGLKELEKILKIEVKEDLSVCKVEKEEYKEEYARLEDMMKGKKKIGNILDALGIKDKSLICNAWKSGLTWETICSVIILQRLIVFKEVILETGRGIFKFTRSHGNYDIFETLQNAPIKASDPYLC